MDIVRFALRTQTLHAGSNDTRKTNATNRSEEEIEDVEGDVLAVNLFIDRVRVVGAADYRFVSESTCVTYNTATVTSASSPASPTCTTQRQ